MKVNKMIGKALAATVAATMMLGGATVMAAESWAPPGYSSARPIEYGTKYHVQCGFDYTPSSFHREGKWFCFTPDHSGSYTFESYGAPDINADDGSLDPNSILFDENLDFIEADSRNDDTDTSRNFGFSADLIGGQPYYFYTGDQSGNDAGFDFMITNFIPAEDRYNINLNNLNGVDVLEFSEHHTHIYGYPIAVRFGSLITGRYVSADFWLDGNQVIFEGYDENGNCNRHNYSMGVNLLYLDPVIRNGEIEVEPISENYLGRCRANSSFKAMEGTHISDSELNDGDILEAKPGNIVLEGHFAFVKDGGWLDYFDYGAFRFDEENNCIVYDWSHEYIGTYESGASSFRIEKYHGTTLLYLIPADEAVDEPVAPDFGMNLDDEDDDEPVAPDYGGLDEDYLDEPVAPDFGMNLDDEDDIEPVAPDYGGLDEDNLDEPVAPDFGMNLDDEDDEPVISDSDNKSVVEDTSVITDVPVVSGTTVPVVQSTTVAGTSRTLTEIFVDRLYENALNRSSDIVCRDEFVDLLNNGLTATDLIKIFLGSSEFASRDLDNEAFVKTLYSVFCNRTVSQSEIDSCIEDLNNGTSRDQMIDAFLASADWSSTCAQFEVNV